MAGPTPRRPSPASRASWATGLVWPATLGGPPAVDDRQQVGDPVDHRVRHTLRVAVLLRRDLAVRHVYRPHAGRLRAVDVLEQPVADVDGAGGVADPDRPHR